MSVVFLDIDHVLNDGIFNQESQSTSFKPDCVQRLNRILEAVPEARLVLSSSWRYLILKGAMTIAGFDSLLRTHGVMPHRLIGTTCLDEEIAERHDQIMDWIAKHHEARRHEQIQTWIAEHSATEENYVVLDDIDMTHQFRDRMILVDTTNGLQDHHVERAIELLRKQ